ncbi:MAG: DNA topoisomerase I [Candidatus Nanoarchaeia archaeon]|nr:DNA topoisomerase I [Candidatus Nanoarchaeia archaeon]
MKLIVSEKVMAGEKLSEFLSQNKAKKTKEKEVPVWTHKDWVIVPMSGHILNYDFSEDFSDWSKTDMEELVNSEKIITKTLPNVCDLIAKYAKKADELIIATDYDREGEAIGYEAVDIAVEKNPKIKLKRARFSALTKDEIIASFEDKNLVIPDKNLSDAANARREIDLYWGAALTRLISVIAQRLGRMYLSVGRVQSPTLAIITDREKERMVFKPERYWEISANLGFSKNKFTAKHNPFKIKKKEEAQRIQNLKEKTAKVIEIEKKQERTKPPAPFNTTSFLSAASNIGFSVANAMRLAESLYLKGLISYPRTSNTVYPEAIKLRELLQELSKQSTLGKFAKEILEKKEIIPTRGKKKTTDHPPIYPVAPADKSKLSQQEWKLYQLVFRRFIATLSDTSLEEKARMLFEAGKEIFSINGFRVIEPGWRKYYKYSSKEEVEIPNLKKGDLVEILKINSNEKETQPPRRYGQGSLIKLMDDLNLGTKATRHDILKKLIYRGYVLATNMEPTNIAMALTEVMKEYAPKITKPEMTAQLEEYMDDIEQGKKTLSEVVKTSKELLLEVIKTIENQKEAVGEKLREALIQDRIVGPCNKCGEEMIIVRSKGSRKRFIACKGYPKCENSYPLPQTGKLLVLSSKCEGCNTNYISVIMFGKRPWKFCPNIDCPKRQEEEYIIELKKKKAEEEKLKTLKEEKTIN